MLNALFAAATLAIAATSYAPKVHLAYTLRVDSADLSAISVELRIQGAPARFTLAAHAHPEYDDRYWRYIEGLSARDAAGRELAITRLDSMRWSIANARGAVTVTYLVRFPREELPRSSWKPFLSPIGALVGGPHSFLYITGLEQSPASVTLDIPVSWKVATGLAGTSTARTFTAPDIFTLMESPMLTGTMSEWAFSVKGVPHRTFYWRLPNAAPFDTVAFSSGVERFTRAAFDLFGGAPYRAYTFMFMDGAYGGGLEHPNSVTLGGQSVELARNPHATIAEIAHEFVHTWNLMAIKPIEYRKVDWRPQPPVASLWFSEGLTIFYADLLRRRAGLPVQDTNRTAHLAELVERYLSSPGNAHFSAEQVSRVEYNASPAALGDYSASSHLLGELIGTLLDIRVRDATDGARSMDDVMRLMYQRFTRRGFTGRDIERAVGDACRCGAAEIFDSYVRSGTAIDFDKHLAPLGLSVTTKWIPGVDNDGRPLRDLRIWGWQDGSDPVRLRVTDPASAWGQAGLHSGDKLDSIDGKPIRTWPEMRAALTRLQIGDTATFVVNRAAGRFETKVVMRGHDRPVVTIDELPNATAKQLRLREAWLRGER